VFSLTSLSLTVMPSVDVTGCRLSVRCDMTGFVEREWLKSAEQVRDQPPSPWPACHRAHLRGYGRKAAVTAITLPVGTGGERPIRVAWSVRFTIDSFGAVPDLPWTTRAEMEPGSGYLVMASHLPLKRISSTVRFFRGVTAVRRQLAAADGLVGYMLRAKPLARDYWTLSV
jgi:hypothetical protein